MSDIVLGALIALGSAILVTIITGIINYKNSTRKIDRIALFLMSSTLLPEHSLNSLSISFVDSACITFFSGFGFLGYPLGYQELTAQWLTS